LKIIGDKACPACRAKGRDSKENHLILFQDGEKKWGKCNRCGHYEAPEGNLEYTPRSERSPEELKAELEEVLTYPCEPLTTRRISKATANWYGVRVGLSPANGKDVIEHYYPRTKDRKLVAFNVRNLDPKGFYYRGSPKGGVDPFGFVQMLHKSIGHLRLIIAEDELSAMSLFEIFQARMGEQYAGIKTAVISWSSGVGSCARDIAMLQQGGYLSKFKEVVYVHDNDDAGRGSVETVRALLPDCKFVQLPLKDANDMYMAGREEEVYQAVRYNGKTKSPDCAVTVDDIYEESLAPPKWGLSYPWEGLTNLTFGQRNGEIIGIGGGTGIGKTLLAHQMAAWNITEHGENAGVFLLEESAPMSLKNIAGKVARKAFHRPDLEWDETSFKDAVGKLRGKLHLWRNKGQNDWDNIKECIRYWAVVESVKSVFLDNITALTNHLSPSEQNTEIARIATELAGLADELNIRIFVFSHLNPPKGKLSHEEGAEVKEHQFTGSRALQRWCQLILGFERNKQASGDEKHNSRIRVIKDRNYGNTGLVFTKYNPDTGCLDERFDGSEEEIPREDEDEPI
jgi:twinkle protein